MPLVHRCVVALTVLSLAWAQDPAKTDLSLAAEPLTLDEALELAERFNPRLRASMAAREGAEAGIVTARAYPNPELNYMAGPQFRRLPGAEPGLLQRFAATQMLELPSVRRTRIDAAQQGRQSSGFAMSDARLSVRGDVQFAFYQILRRRGEVDLAQDTLRLIEELRRRIQVQVDVGEAARLELTRADAETATAQALVNSARLRLLNAESALRAAVSAPLPPRFEARGSLDPPVLLPALDSLRATVAVQHPLIAQAEAEVRRAQAILDNQTALRKPQPQLQAEYELQPDLQYYRIGVNLPVPFWNRRQGPIGEAVAALNQAEALVDLRRIELTAAVERAYGQYQVANQQVAAFEKGVLQGAEAAVQAAEAAFRFGERGIIEVLDAQRVLRTVRTEFLNAQFDRQSALIDLERLQAYDSSRRP